MSDAQHVQTIAKAFALLECMAQGKGPLSLGEIAELTGYAKSTVHHYLSTLKDLSIVSQSPADGRYSLSVRLFSLGCSASRAWKIINIAKPFMQRISREIDEAVSLAVLDKGEALTIEFVESSKLVHFVSRVGKTLPAHATVQGKVLLANIPEEQVLQILTERGMKPYTPTTITTPEVMIEELRTIRERGYAIDNSEFHVGACSVGAPIFNVYGESGYALAVISMFQCIGTPKFDYVRNMVMEAAHNISRSLGYYGV